MNKLTMSLFLILSMGIGSTTMADNQYWAHSPVTISVFFSNPSGRLTLIPTERNQAEIQPNNQLMFDNNNHFRKFDLHMVLDKVLWLPGSMHQHEDVQSFAIQYEEGGKRELLGSMAILGTKFGTNTSNKWPRNLVKIPISIIPWIVIRDNPEAKHILRIRDPIEFKYDFINPEKDYNDQNIKWEKTNEMVFEVDPLSRTENKKDKV